MHANEKWNHVKQKLENKECSGYIHATGVLKAAP